MINKLIVSPSPHIKGNVTTSRLMRDVIIALIPAFLVSVLFFGIASVIITAVAVVSCMAFEYLICRYMLGSASTLKDYSAALTGLLLAFNLPPSIPVWMVIVGSLVAIGVGKMSFGGLGSNPFNPALVGRVFMLISFPASMASFSPTTISPDALSGATPLSFMKEAIKNNQPISELMGNFSYTSLMIGDKAGSLGEVASIALLLGFAYLLYRKVITWHIPIYILGTMAIFSGIFWLINPEMYLSPLFQIFTGGAILGAVYMATDYVTSPMNTKGMAIYGIGIGLITIIVRMWGSYPEGISFAILIMNGVTPLINKYTKPHRFGEIIKK